MKFTVKQAQKRIRIKMIRELTKEKYDPVLILELAESLMIVSEPLKFELIEKILNEN